MGLAHSPSVVTNGLVAYLDAGNSKGFDDDENLMTNSQLGTTILNDGNGVTLTTDTTIVNPFGAYDGVLKCVHTTNTPGYFRRGQNMSLTAGVTYTFSFFFKNGTVVSPYGQNRLNIGLLASTYSPTFDETEQGLNQNNLVGDGWYRQVFTFTPSYTQTYQVDFNQANNQTPLGTYYLYGFQLERGSSASPYYATTGTAKNRGTTLIDMTGRGNTGTLTNGPTYNSSNGGSIVFDGVDDYVNCGTFFNYANFTISLWVYPGSTQVTYADIFDNNHTGTQNFVCQQNAATTNQYAFGCLNATNASSTSNFTLTANTWHHLTFTWNNSVASAYINGVFHSSGAAANAINYSNPILSIGRWSAGGRNWNGRISNFVAYNTALSAAEIRQNFNALRGRFGI